jgi:beta-lactam-binding protein with PASTA domain
MIKLPKLTEMSVRSAEQQLLIAGLLKPSLEYQNDIRENEVLEVKYQGENRCWNVNCKRFEGYAHRGQWHR